MNTISKISVVCLLTIVCSIFSYNLGLSDNREIVSAHSEVRGRIKQLIEITDKLGYTVTKSNHDSLTILESFGIKDLNYYIIESKGVKTVAIYE